jgi:hypothetical protein
MCFPKMTTLVLGIIQISSCPIFATRKEKCPLRTVTNAYTTIKEEGKYPVVDSVDSCTRKRKESIPALLCMNVISACKIYWYRTLGTSIQRKSLN